MIIDDSLVDIDTYIYRRTRRIAIAGQLSGRYPCAPRRARNYGPEGHVWAAGLFDKSYISPISVSLGVTFTRSSKAV